MSWVSVLPPLLAIAIALRFKDVLLALLAAILLAELLLAGTMSMTAFAHAVDRIIAVFSSADNTRILLFSLLVGALMALLRESGSIAAFVRWLLATGMARTPRAAAMLTTGLGIVIFIETYLSMLVTGSFAQRLFDRHGLSRARLALIVDTTSSPVSVLILLNGWGAYILGLLQNQGLDDPLAVMLGSIPLNFYALLILLLVGYVAWSGKVHFAMANHEKQSAAIAGNTSDVAGGKASHFLLPLLCLTFGIVAFMWLTGNGNLMAGSGAKSVLYAVLLALAVSYCQLRLGNVMPHADIVRHAYTGLGELLPIVTILLLAFAFGACMQDLQTGRYVASLLPPGLPLWLVAPAVFLSGCFISFTTGTSWGTFAILIPVAMPLALATGLPPSLLLAAVLSGGVFGDHCSPVSDSTILSSLSSGCDHLVHTATQLPYALMAGAASLLLFAVMGM